MQFKIQHKLTFDSPQNLITQLPRSNRKTKTMLRSFRSGLKDNNPFDLTSTLGKDQKQIKTLVESKIQQLHDKMSSFFSQQRKTHLQQIAPEMQEIANSIMQLKQQLNRPKSMAEIEQQKHGLLKRKVALLREIEQTNKKMKQNKAIFYELKFDSQQLDRQLKNGHATIAKYKRKLGADKTKIQAKQVTLSETNQPCSQNDENIEKILNQSLCQQNIPSTTDKESTPQISEQTTQRQDYHLHITEVMTHVQNSYKKNQETRQNTIKISQTQSEKQQVVNPTNFHNINRNQQLNKSHSLAYGLMNKKNKHHISYVLHNQQTQISQKNNSNNSFEQYLNCNSLSEAVKKPHHHKYTKSILKNTLDMSSELRKYEQIANKQKWNQIDSIFAQLELPPTKNCSFPKTQNLDGGKKQKNNAKISDLEELLMDELRKQQFQSYKEKGYHQGLKDKTHQIKIEIKRIFKNYSADDFFESIINKKPIKKQLAMILEDSLN